MADETLTLALHGEVSLEVFAEAVNRWNELIEALTRHVAPSSRVRWVIADLAASSAIATVRPIGAVETVRPVADAYVDLGHKMAAGTVATYAPDVRDPASSLAALVNGEVEFMRFETAHEDAIISSRPRIEVAPEPLEPAVAVAPAFGGVQGRVQTLTSRGGLRFTLYDLLHDKAVSCYLSEGQEDIMRDVWGQLALVEGIVTRDPKSGRPLTVREIRNVTSIRQVAPDAYGAARGVVKPLPGDLRMPEDLVSAARDA